MIKDSGGYWSRGPRCPPLPKPGWMSKQTVWAGWGRDDGVAFRGGGYRRAPAKAPGPVIPY